LESLSKVQHFIQHKEAAVAFRFTSDMRRVIAEQVLAYVATVCPDNTPNLAAQGTLGVYDECHLIFADLKSPQTVSNLRLNPAIEINVVDPFLRCGYRFKGRGEVFHSGIAFERLRRFYAGIWLDTGKKPPLDDIRHIVLVNVERALTMTAPAYQRGEDELEIARHWEDYYHSLAHKRRTSFV
jgi:hypothetical protein